MFKITNIQAASAIGALLILLSGNAFAVTAYATQAGLNGEISNRKAADTAEVTNRNTAISTERIRATGAEGTLKAALVTETARAKAAEAAGLGTIAHSAPVIVDANGQYIATYIVGGISGVNSIEARGIIEQSDFFIYLITDSLGFTIQNHYYLSYWENSSCSGETTITMPDTFNTIMTLSAFSLSPDPNYQGGMNMLGRNLTGFYYIPANIDQAYTGSVYTWNGLACVLAPPASQTQMYVKPLLNNPTVTGFDPAILKLPFKITTNY